MKVESYLFLSLMLLKTVSVIPLAVGKFGLLTGVGFMALNVIGYGLLIYFAEQDKRRPQRTQG